MQLVPSNSTQSSEALAHKGKVVIHSGPDLRGSKRLRIEELTVVSGVVMPPIQVRDTQEAHGYNPSTDEQGRITKQTTHSAKGHLILFYTAKVRSVNQAEMKKELALESGYCLIRITGMSFKFSSVSAIDSL
ncbi:hypothetical protein C5167_042885 [Papaver somniferum]|uniref:Uncharacterized protein n=1 Tax=Papaver somniferum TaxID=3469 RepID=A0A4Y7L6S0_PAPSO|nr:hypothetical protein C5167_042885 [Papaver somniferum]